MSWRVVVVTRIPQVLLGFSGVAQSLGHDVVAVLTHGPEQLEALVAAVPAGADLLLPAKRSSIAPLLRAVEPDLVLCMGFPWKIPAAAIAVPTLGWLNGHPSLLPKHRGPVPLSWAIRHGDTESGVTFHFMDAELDTGPIVAQRSFEIGDFLEPEEFYGRMGEIVGPLLYEALEKIAAGERGTPQPAGGGYETFFTDQDVWLDLTKPREEVHRLVWAWRYTIPVGTERGPLLELDGETVRVLRTSLDEVPGAVRIDAGDGALWLVTTEPAPEAPVPARRP